MSHVDEESPASMLLMKGDVIQEINRKKITGMSDYEQVVSLIKADTDILLLIFRGGSSLFFIIFSQCLRNFFIKFL